jgi:hypothetical protein
MEQLAEDCLRLIDHPDERQALEAAGFDCIAGRDIRVILQNALAQA